jgi:hypothetical protein
MAIDELSVVAAVGWCIAQTCLYVGSLYMWPNALMLPRDHPTTILRRITSVLLVSCISALLMFVLLPECDACSLV